MDLGTMRKKLKAGSYQTFDSFDQDAQLVYNNCMAFNAPGTTFYNGADRYKKAWLKFKLKYKDVDAHHEAKKAAAASGHKRVSERMKEEEGDMNGLID